MHLFIVKLGKISFLFIICYWFFYIQVNKDYHYNNHLHSSIDVVVQ